MPTLVVSMNKTSAIRQVVNYEHQYGTKVDRTVTNSHLFPNKMLQNVEIGSLLCCCTQQDYEHMFPVPTVSIVICFVHLELWFRENCPLVNSLTFRGRLPAVLSLQTFILNWKSARIGLLLFNAKSHLNYKSIKIYNEKRKSLQREGSQKSKASPLFCFPMPYFCGFYVTASALLHVQTMLTAKGSLRGSLLEALSCWKAGTQAEALEYKLGSLGPLSYIPSGRLLMYLYLIFALVLLFLLFCFRETFPFRWNYCLGWFSEMGLEGSGHNKLLGLRMTSKHKRSKR